METKTALFIKFNSESLFAMKEAINENPELARPNNYETRCALHRIALICYNKERLDKNSLAEIYFSIQFIDNLEERKYSEDEEIKDLFSEDENIMERYREEKNILTSALIEKIRNYPDFLLPIDELRARIDFLYEIYPEKEMKSDWHLKDLTNDESMEITGESELKHRLTEAFYAKYVLKLKIKTMNKEELLQTMDILVWLKRASITGRYLHRNLEEEINLIQERNREIRKEVK